MQLAAVTDLNTIPQLALIVELNTGDVDDRLGVESGAAHLAVIGTRTGTGVGCGSKIIGAGKIGAGVNITGHSRVNLDFGQQGTLKPEHTVIIIHHLIPFGSVERESFTGTADDRIVGVCIAEAVSIISGTRTFSHVDLAGGSEHLIAGIYRNEVSVVRTYPAGFAGRILDLVPISAVLIGFSLVEILEGSVGIDGSDLVAVTVAGGGANLNTAAALGHIGDDISAFACFRGIDVAGGAGRHSGDADADQHDEGKDERSDSELFHFEFLQLLWFWLLISKNGHKKSPTFFTGRAGRMYSVVSGHGGEGILAYGNCLLS